MKHLLLLMVLVSFVAAGFVVNDTNKGTRGVATMSADSSIVTYQHDASDDINAIVLDSFELRYADPVEDAIVGPSAYTWIFVKIYPNGNVISDTLHVREFGSVDWTPTFGY